MKFCPKFLVIAGAALIGWAAPALALEIPSATGFVNDFAGILSADEKETLENFCQNFAEETSNEIAVAIFDTLDGEPIESVGIQLGEKWQVGTKQNDNGVIFVVAVADHKMRIEVGRGLEGVLTDLGTKYLQDTYAAPKFRADNYFGGIQAVVTEIAKVARGEYDLPEVDTEELSFYEEVAGHLIVFLFLWLASVLARSKSWWAGGAVGAGLGTLLGIFHGDFVANIITLGIIGLILDFVVSHNYQKSQGSGGSPSWWAGGSSFGSSGSSSSSGGFSGFSGGSFSGGGSSSSW